MYNDPKHIRNRRVNLSLSETEDRLVEAAAEFNEMQKASFLRRLVLEGLSRWNPFHAADSDDDQGDKRVNQL